MSSCLEPLERIFQQVEEESERRAQDELSSLPSDALSSINAELSARRLKSRRRGSISISRIGQFSEELSKSPSGPSTPNLASAIASRSPFYQEQIANGSTASFASVDSRLLDDGAHAEDHSQVTQVYQISSRQSISRTIGTLLPRRLSRARSMNVLSSSPVETNMVIGVSVQHATVETREGEDTITKRASVHAPGSLRTQTSRSTISGSAPPISSWVTKAKGFTMKFRRKGTKSPSPPLAPDVLN